MRRTKIVVLPDVHFPYQDNRALDAVFSFLGAYVGQNEQAVICQLGDLVDCYTISRFSKSPERIDSLQDEIDLATSFLAAIRRQHPRARLFYQEGNHEDRLHSLRSSGTGLGSLRGLTWPELLSLDKLKISHCKYKSCHEPFPGFRVEHGNVVRAGSGRSAHGQLVQASRGRGVCAGVSGHTHRLALVTARIAGETRFWVEAGHLASPVVSEEYLHGDPDWAQGLAVGFHDATGTYLWPCPIVHLPDGSARVCHPLEVE